MIDIFWRAGRNGESHRTVLESAQAQVSAMLREALESNERPARGGTSKGS